MFEDKFKVNEIKNKVSDDENKCKERKIRIFGAKIEIREIKAKSFQDEINLKNEIKINKIKLLKLKLCGDVK